MRRNFLDEKLSNPKDLIGSNKLPIHLWPSSATAMGCMALLDGALKYGRSNWRVAGVRASIYFDAANRHLSKWFEGEDLDGDSGLPHLSHALACLAILVDSEAAGMLVDDRQIEGGYKGLCEKLSPSIEHLRSKHSQKKPRHYTIKDNDEV